MRGIGIGKSLLVYTDSVSGQSQLFIYKPNPEKYITFDLRDSVNVYAGYLPTSTVRHTIHGTIYSSVYDALAKLKLRPAMTTELIDVFGWKVSFQHIQPGDQFTIIYDDHIVDSISVDHSIVAAHLVHAKRDYHAIRFEHDGKEDFFDLQGQGLRGQFLRSPVQYSRISSRYSKRRFHPVQKRYKPHLGTDFAAPAGTPVFSTADGTVTRPGMDKPTDAMSELGTERLMKQLICICPG